MGKYPTEAGIYKLTCILNGKVYIGKGNIISKRISYHKKSKGSGYLQNSIAKYGWDSFTVEILEIFEDFDKSKDNFDLLKRESYYIELFDSTNRDKGYNRCKFSNDNTGILWTEESKEKIRGRVISDETKEKMRQANTGKTHSKYTKEKIRNARLGMKFSEDTKEKMKTRRHSDEAKEKMRQARLGRKLSDETKEKMRQARLGRKLSDETKEKMSNSKLGKLKSEETKEKMRQANLGKKLSKETKDKIKQTKKNAKDKILNP